MTARGRRLGSVAAAALLSFAAPAAARPPTQDGGRPIVIGRSYSLPSRVLGDVRTLNVYLPPHYGEPGRRFPVLFLLDGGEAEDFHHVSGLAQVVAFSGRTEEIIVVGVAGVDRRHDLTPPSSDPADLGVVPQAGGAEAYRRFLVEEVKPWVAARYPAGGRTALMGESLAGLFVLDTLLHAPTSFDDYVAVDPSLWWNRAALAANAAAALHRASFAGRRLWVSTADDGPQIAAAQDRLHAALRADAPVGFAWTWDARPGERHDSLYQPAANAALRALYASPTSGGR